MADEITLPSRYEIKKSLGSGGAGRVILAYDSIRKNMVAVKILRQAKHLKKDHLVKEFNILSELNHPNLVKVYDFGFITEQIPYYSMEYIKGNNLYTFLSKTKNLHYLPEIIEQTLMALEYLHKKELLHADIKPENILIMDMNERINIKLVDFGLVLLTSQNKSNISGTVRFIAPEILSGNKYSPASDLYAFGVSLIEALTQAPVSITTNIADSNYQDKFNTISDLLIRSGILNATSLTSYIINLSNHKIEDRPQTADEALKSLTITLGKSIRNTDFNIDEIFIYRSETMEKIRSFFSMTEGSTLILEGYT
ncbi:MAG: serine/threonine protein kinase, partial [bacterium]